MNHQSIPTLPTLVPNPNHATKPQPPYNSKAQPTQHFHLGPFNININYYPTSQLNPNANPTINGCHNVSHSSNQSVILTSRHQKK